MTTSRAQDAPPTPRSSSVGGGNDDLRRMVLLLETADVLQRRARRTGDPTQVAVLLRRADQRRQEADALRERLASRGAALGGQQAASLLAPGPADVFRGPQLRRRRN
jgi:hypothetical protein